MSLEGAQVAFISPDRLVISLKSGELYVLSLFADSMRSVRGFHFDKAAASVLTSCVSNISNEKSHIYMKHTPNLILTVRYVCAKITIFSLAHVLEIHYYSGSLRKNQKMNKI